MHPFIKSFLKYKVRSIDDKKMRRISLVLGSTNDGRYNVLACGHTETKPLLYPLEEAFSAPPFIECEACEKLFSERGQSELL